MIFYTLIPTLIILNFILYIEGKKGFNLFAVGFMSGMLVARIFVDLGYT